MTAVERLRASGCVFAEREAALLRAEAADSAAFEAMVAERASGVPLEWVLGWAEFCGRRVPIDRGVFVPRRRTQRLAEIAVEMCEPGHRVLDLGCGSGALALVLASTGRPSRTVALDIDPAAVANARRSLADCAAEVALSDLFDALAVDERFDVIVANLPYVPHGQVDYLPRDSRLHEPAYTFDGGSDGLAPLRRVAPDLTSRLTEGGTFLTELHRDQVADAERLLRASGLHVRTRKAGGATRVVLALLHSESPGQIVAAGGAWVV